MIRALGICALAAALLAGCDRERRVLDPPPSTRPGPAVGAAQGDLAPGAAGAGLKEVTHARDYDGENAWQIAQGKRLFRWFNCSGCHSSGGGGMGPPLMDDKWLYGHDPDAIYQTIMEGRPNGMPSFKGRVLDQQAWQLVAYVRSMNGLASKAARSGRGDELGGAIKPESERPRGHPRDEPKGK
jgi:cytochrome c oxidase cbb3-type subunit III